MITRLKKQTSLILMFVFRSLSCVRRRLQLRSRRGRWKSVWKWTCWRSNGSHVRRWAPSLWTPLFTDWSTSSVPRQSSINISTIFPFTFAFPRCSASPSCRRYWTFWRRARQTSLSTQSFTLPVPWTSNISALPSYLAGAAVSPPTNTQLWISIMSPNHLIILCSVTNLISPYVAKPTTINSKIEGF